MNFQQMQNFAKQYANTYVETSVSEATPHKLVQMLYEGVIKNVKLAKLFMEQKNYEKKTEHLNKSLSIVLHLREGVDFDKGKDIAENLYALYDYCYRQLLSGSLKNNPEPLDEVLGHFEGLADAWNQIPDNFKRLSKDQLQRVGTN